MAKIKVNDIKVNDIKLAGTELFEDAESFINDLSDKELEISGGRLILACCHTSHNDEPVMRALV